MSRIERLCAALAAVVLAAILTDDIGILATGIAAALALVLGRGVWLRHLLAIAWTMVTIETLAGVPKDAMVFSIAVTDLVIALAALARATQDRSRIDARWIGAISLLLMVAHWLMSVSQGLPPWWLYASIVNIGFILQCLIIGGWLDHVGRSVGRVVARLNPVHLFRRGER